MQKGSLMTKKNIKSKKGFTIIEVVLVLSIARLIFLMVFVALPALQRSQRDTQRRDDMARFLTQLNQYQANNGGNVPTDYSSFVTNYLKVGGDTFADPSAGDYTVANTVINCASGAAGCSNRNNTDLGTITVYTNATCDGESPVYAQGDRRVAIVLSLEGAGIYCGHN